MISRDAARLPREAPAGLVVAIDELPELVTRSPELPTVLQKLVDGAARGPALVVAGSSQRMMQGLVLDAAAPLYGEALVALEEKARRVPGLERVRLDLAVFVLRKKGRIDDPRVIDASEIVGALR